MAKRKGETVEQYLRRCRIAEIERKIFCFWPVLIPIIYAIFFVMAITEPAPLIIP